MPKLYAPNGVTIAGTADTVHCVAFILDDNVRRRSDGTFEFDLMGETEIDWDTQETRRAPGGRLFVDANDVHWQERDLLLLTDEEHADRFRRLQGANVLDPVILASMRVDPVILASMRVDQRGALTHHGYSATPDHAVVAAHILNAAEAANVVDDWAMFDVLRDYLDGNSTELEAVTQLYEIAGVPFDPNA